MTKNKFSALVRSPYYIWLFLVFTIITHIPTPTTQLASDDFVAWAAMTKPPEAQNIGFQVANADNNFFDQLSNAFMFLSAKNNSVQEMKSYGSLPWWTPDNVTMHMYRPITAATHWVDYNVIGIDNMWLIKFHSVIWLCFLAFSYFVLCKKLGAPSWVPALAVAFYVFSSTMPQNLQWLAARNAIIAPLFGNLALLAHISWRESGSLKYLAISLLMLTLAVLSAEAGITTIVYIGLYALILDTKATTPKTAIKNLLSVMPYLFVILAWRIYYSYAGYGAEHIGLYTDPVRSPYQFITEQLPLLPIAFLKLTLGFLSYAFGLLTKSMGLIAFMAAILSVGCLIWVWPAVKRDKLLIYCVLVTLFGTLPFLATFPGARMDPFLHVAFCLALSLIIYKLANKQAVIIGVKPFISLALALHLLLPGTLVILVNSGIINIGNKSDEPHASEEIRIDENSDLVIINPPNYFVYYNRPLKWLYHGKPLPKKLHLLAPGLTGMTIKRDSTSSYHLSAKEGFPVLSNTPHNIEHREDPKNNGWDVIFHRNNNAIMTGKTHQLYEGQLIELNGYTVEIIKMKDNLPRSIRFRFTETLNQVWQWYNWEEEKYEYIEPLEVGSSRYIAGPFE